MDHSGLRITSNVHSELPHTRELRHLTLAQIDEDQSLFGPGGEAYDGVEFGERGGFRAEGRRRKMFQLLSDGLHTPDEHELRRRKALVFQIRMYRPMHQHVDNQNHPFTRIRDQLYSFVKQA